MITWTVIEYDRGIRIIAQGLTREFAERVVERRSIAGTGVWRMHPVQEIDRGDE
jgi:hypothetical protein